MMVKSYVKLVLCTEECLEESTFNLADVCR